MNGMAARGADRHGGAFADATGVDGTPAAPGVGDAAGEVAELAGVAWHISTRSGNTSGNCVEAGPLLDSSGRVAVRHSRFPDGAVVVYTRAEWEAFIGGLKDGEFDFSGD